ncbi:hypothetical protein GCM10022255_052920 [Dactylosporangium darangshiense]|uniref:VWA domain-containing protein n=1 Tax=Dactylosporangium darangshiense TaxID=579108 RepID=A0ABP8DDA8_9ACTN
MHGPESIKDNTTKTAGSTDFLVPNVIGVTNTFVHHLQHHDGVLRVPRAGAVVWDDEELHVAAHRADPEGYALSALAPGALAGQRARILLRLLTASWAGIEPGTRDTLNRVTRVLALGLPPADVLTVLLAARRRRANHKHVTRTTLAVLFEHPHAAELIRARRGMAVDCFEHALGKATARGRYAAGGVAALYEPAGTAVLAPPPATLDLDLAGERPGTVTATNRGDLAATLVHALRGGPSAELEAAADGYARALTDGMPRYGGRIALVVDASASMRGYGNREWAVMSQVAALRMVLDRLCERLVVVQAGGLPDGRPGGHTDLAGAVLDAVAHEPDVVAVASDGYENVYPGDLARVAAALPGAGVRAPVVFCQAAFGRADDLSLRRAADGLPLRTFWHSADLAALVLWMLSHVDGAEAGRWIGRELRRRLDVLEVQLR